MTLQAAILCGGKSSRFGSDKALAPLLKESEPILQTLASLLTELNLRPLILSGLPDRYEQHGLSGIKDVFKNCGPLSGIHAGLRHNPENDLLILTVDMPKVSAKDIQELVTAYQKRALPTFFTFNSDLLPFPGIYTQNLLVDIENRLKQEKHSLIEFLVTKTNKNLIPHSNLNHFSNINTQQDLQNLKKG